MIDSAELERTLVALIQQIPEIGPLMGDDPVGNVEAYIDQFAKYASLQLFIRDMQPPHIVVGYMGTQPGGSSQMTAWTHSVGISIKTGQQTAEQPSAYTQVFQAIWKGIPSSGTDPLSQIPVLPNLLPMNVPSLERRNDPEGLDYFEAVLSFEEIGDV